MQPIIAVLSWYTATTTDDIPGWLLGDISTEWILSLFYGSGEIDESMAATGYHARNTVIIYTYTSCILLISLQRSRWLMASPSFAIGLC